MLWEEFSGIGQRTYYFIFILIHFKQIIQTIQCCFTQTWRTYSHPSGLLPTTSHWVQLHLADDI